MGREHLDSSFYGNVILPSSLPSILIFRNDTFRSFERSLLELGLARILTRTFGIRRRYTVYAQRTVKAIMQQITPWAEWSTVPAQKTLSLQTLNRAICNYGHRFILAIKLMY